MVVYVSSDSPDTEHSLLSPLNHRKKVCHSSRHVCLPFKLLVLRLSPVSCVGSTSGLESTAKATKSTPICFGLVK